MPVPCPSCGNPLGIDLEFIINNPISKCPHCLVVMNFNVNSDIIQEFKKVTNQINKIKKSTIIKTNK
jgi:hypothetical protein